MGFGRYVFISLLFLKTSTILRMQAEHSILLELDWKVSYVKHHLMFGMSRCNNQHLFACPFHKGPLKLDTMNSSKKDARIPHCEQTTIYDSTMSTRRTKRYAGRIKRVLPAIKQQSHASVYRDNREP